jgi:hypothetical protein
MTDKEVMQMALDALEEAYHPNTDVAVVMEALRAKLEQTDMQIGVTYEEANSPVAWVWNVDSGAGYLSKGIGFEQTNIPFAKHTPLYTAPPQRDFKFSTIEEAMQLMPESTGQPQLTDDEAQFADSFTTLLKAGFGKEAEIVLKCKRKWIGLTDEEIAEGIINSYVIGQTFKSAVWWAEAKLKEKNK